MQLHGAEIRTGNNYPTCAHGRVEFPTHPAWRVRRRYPARDAFAREDGRPGRCRFGPGPPIGTIQAGKATLYNLAGAHTASGEALDAVTATAAHRPLASYARVMNLDSGRSIIVKINDRALAASLLIFHSPQAVDETGVRRTGVAPVIVEPVAVDATSAGAAPTLATYHQGDTAR